MTAGQADGTKVRRATYSKVGVAVGVACRAAGRRLATVQILTTGKREAVRDVAEMNSSTGNEILALRAVGRSRAASPLRYPGGKAALAGFFGNAIELLRISPATYVEPYAGGAGAGISLLLEDQVDRLVINDIDPAVYCFWRAIVEMNDEFVALLSDVPLSVDEWRRQKETYKASDESDPLRLGFAFFYLNRTNRSGILHAGPIGGVQQNGSYKIDARFNRDQLVTRISRIGEKRKRIEVSSVDGRSVVNRFAEDSNAFIYIDPPYVDMGGSLYLNAFTHHDHAQLAATLDASPSGNWIVTYDPSEFIRKLYKNHDTREYQLNYSARRAEKAHELMISSRPIAKLLE